VSSFHTYWGYFSAALAGIVGIWGLVISRRADPPRVFLQAVGFVIVALIAQIVLGVILYSAGTDPGNQHVFYGVVIAVTFSLAYIYRSQFRKRPALYYGLLLLFCMGLAIRGILTFGNSF
jgi:ABC-type spermidine/putrescine transport system permease subunit II